MGGTVTGGMSGGGSQRPARPRDASAGVSVSGKIEKKREEKVIKGVSL
jgi:hypothetical protein